MLEDLDTGPNIFEDLGEPPPPGFKGKSGLMRGPCRKDVDLRSISVFVVDTKMNPKINTETF